MRLATRSFRGLSRVLGLRRWVVRLFEHPPRGWDACRASRFGRDFSAEEWQVEGRWVVTVRLRTDASRTDGPSPARRHVVFFHGGGYVVEASPRHRRLIERLVREEGFVVSAVDYPLAPESTAKDAHCVALKAYSRLVERHPGDAFCLLGDSAGGGLALAMRMRMRDIGYQPLPRRVSLVSPWLDATLSNPRIPEAARREALLSVETLRATGRSYAGGLDPADPLVSPYFGRVEDLGDVQILVGSEELLLPECRDFAERIGKAPGSTVDLWIDEGGSHDGVLGFGSAAVAARRRIAGFLRS